MNERILIVDDEQDTAELLRYNLHKQHYQPLVARNGEEALNIVMRRLPDLVLLDVMMPEMDGWEVCRILRRTPKEWTFPILMLSALSEEEARVKGLELGADDYLTKPFSVKEVLLKVRKHLDRQAALNRLFRKDLEHDTSLRYLVHELRGALSVIGGYSNLALNKDPAGKRYLDKIHGAAAHAENLLHDASLLARLEHDGEQLPRRPIELMGLVRNARELLLDDADARGVRIELVNSTAARVLGDETAARQVLVNLLSNAIKYNQADGKVWIRFAEEGEWVDVSLQDEGRGIPGNELSKIFDKFYRIPGSERVKGAGLGLYIVKRLTEAMGGRISVESAAGTGSAFTVSFQKADAGVRSDVESRDRQAAEMALKRPL